MREQNNFGMPESQGPSRTSIEGVVKDIWREVLKIDQLSVDDNFFDLGGHSVLALQVVARLLDCIGTAHHHFDVERILITTMFEQPTIRALSEQIIAMTTQTLPLAEDREEGML